MGDLGSELLYGIIVKTTKLFQEICWTLCSYPGYNLTGLKILGSTSNEGIMILFNQVKPLFRSKMLIGTDAREKEQPKLVSNQ